MPASIQLAFDSGGLTRPLPRNPLDMIHANIYEWLKVAGYAVFDRVHSRDGRKPFTLSPPDERDGPLTVRITLLDDRLLSEFHDGLSKRPYLVIGSDELPVLRNSAGEWLRNVGMASYEAMGSVPRERATYLFDTATYFSVREMDYPLPDPVRAFKGYHESWQSFAPAHLKLSPGASAAFVEWLESHVGVSSARIETAQIRVQRVEHVGFRGRVTFALDRSRDVAGAFQAEIAHWNELCDLAPFAGTGAKTTHGCGQTVALDRVD